MLSPNKIKHTLFFCIVLFISIPLRGQSGQDLNYIDQEFLIEYSQKTPLERLEVFKKYFIEDFKGDILHKETKRLIGYDIMALTGGRTILLKKHPDSINREMLREIYKYKKKMFKQFYTDYVRIFSNEDDILKFDSLNNLRFRDGITPQHPPLDLSSDYGILSYYFTLGPYERVGFYRDVIADSLYQDKKIRNIMEFDVRVLLIKPFRKYTFWERLKFLFTGKRQVKK